MSREFGTDSHGYFHHRIEMCADDAIAGRDELTRLWGAFLKEFEPIAYAISSSEACDSGPEYPITETIERMRSLSEKLATIASYVQPYHVCMNEAVKRYIKDKLAQEALLP